MEEEIKEGLEKIYNENFSFEIEKEKDWIKLEVYKNEKIFVIIEILYFSDFTLDYNIKNIEQKIDKEIIRQYKRI